MNAALSAVTVLSLCLFTSAFSYFELILAPYFGVNIEYFPQNKELILTKKLQQKRPAKTRLGRAKRAPRFVDAEPFLFLIFLIFVRILFNKLP